MYNCLTKHEESITTDFCGLKQGFFLCDVIFKKNIWVQCDYTKTSFVRSEVIRVESSFPKKNMTESRKKTIVVLDWLRLNLFSNL